MSTLHINESRRVNEEEGIFCAEIEALNIDQDAKIYDFIVIYLVRLLRFLF